MQEGMFYGWSVYAISDGIGNVKFGIAQSIQDRKKLLQTGNAHPLQVLFEVVCQKPGSTRDWRSCQSAAYCIESCIHRWLKQEGRQMTGEWFSVGYHEALDVLSQASTINVGRMGHYLDNCNVEILGPFVLIEEQDHIYWPIAKHYALEVTYGR
jgi:hypothetical protein